MASGEVRWFDARKGFGFIRPDFGPRDVFVHVSAMQATGSEPLAPGQRVAFELTQSGDGRLSALAIHRI